ncbi:MAG: hypothetical protein M1840_000342 [Geoglossum simile]|nr:MAG: hypothetical protein M1840_000342 [Geoglossum simile]
MFHRRRQLSNPVSPGKPDELAPSQTFLSDAQSFSTAAIEANENPSAASAAVQAFLSSRASSQSLSSSAAATALRTHTTSPKPVSEVQTKRTLRRQASTSSNSSASGGQHGQDVRGPYKLVSSGSMTERTFRDISPMRGAGRGRGRSAPPVPVVPDTPPDYQHTTTLGQPIRVGSSSPKRPKGRGPSADHVEDQVPRAAPASDLSPVEEWGLDLTDAPGSVNFSYPIKNPSSPKLAPINDAKPDLGCRLGSLAADDAGMARGLNNGEVAHPQDYIGVAADRQVKKKRASTREAIQGSQLADRTVGSGPRGADETYDKQPPTARQAGPSPQDIPNVNTTATTPGKEKEKPPILPDEQRELQDLRTEYTSPIVSYPLDLGAIPEIGKNDRRDQRNRKTRNAGQLAKQPSTVREDCRREEQEEQGNGRGLESSQWRPRGPRDVQETSDPRWDAPSADSRQIPRPYSQSPPFVPTFLAPATTIASSKVLEPGPVTNSYNNPYANRYPPLSLPRTAHFSTTLPVASDTGQAKHEPPLRSVSPAKSAMKPSPSSRTGSPMGSLLGKGHGHRSVEGSDENSLRSEDGEMSYTRGTSKVKKKARVSFDEDSVVVGRAATPPTSPDSPEGQKAVFGHGRREGVDTDDGIEPVPTLPSFESARPRRKHASGGDDAEEATGSAPATTFAAGSRSSASNRMGASSDFALGAVIAHDLVPKRVSVPRGSEWAKPRLDQPTLSSTDPLPPLVTSVEGTGWASDSEASYRDDNDNESHVVVESRNGDPPKHDVNKTPSVSDTTGAGRHEKTNGANGDIPQLVLVEPTPTLEETVDRHEWLDIPGSFPICCGTETPEGRGMKKVAEHHATDLTPALLGISEPGSKEAVAHYLAGSPTIGEFAAGLSSSAKAAPEGESDSSGESIYSDAAEDLSDLEGDGFGSIDAVVESPVVDNVVTLPVASSTQNPASTSASAAVPPHYQPLRLRQKYDSDSSSDEDEGGSQSYRQRVRTRKMRQAAQATVHALSGNATPEMLKASTRGSRSTRGTSKKNHQVESVSGRPLDLPTMGREPRAPRTDMLSSMKKSARSSTGYNATQPSAHARPANPLPDEAFHHFGVPQPKGLLQKRRVRASAPVLVKPPSITTPDGSHHRSIPRDPAPMPPPPSVSPKKKGKMAALRRTLSHESDSDSGSSFVRHPGAVGSGQCTAMRRTMRSPPIGSEASSMTGSKARPLSSPVGNERKPFNDSTDQRPRPGQVTMRTTMRDSPARTPSLRSKSPERARSPIHLPGFSRSPKQKVATQLGFTSRFSGSRGGRNAKPFKSRFADSSDEEVPIPLTPVRGIPRRFGVESRESTELSDSSDFSGDDEDIRSRSVSPTNPKKLQGNSLRHSGSGRDLTTSISTHSRAPKPTKAPKRGFTFSALGRHKKDPSSKIRKSDIESAARRDTPLERSKLELQASKTAISPTTRKIIAFKAFAASTWPLRHHHPNEATTATPTNPSNGEEATGNEADADGGEEATKVEAEADDGEEATKAQADATNDRGGSSETEGPGESDAESVVRKAGGRKKRFRALRRVFGLNG